MTVIDYGYLQSIWDYMMNVVGNEYGVAGLMGNLYAESNCVPYRIQGDFTTGFTVSTDYTTKVDNGTITEYSFVHNYYAYGGSTYGKGYGLAQWTTSGRKQGLYDLFESGYPSIGDITLQLDWLTQELINSYSSTLLVLQNATSIKQASDYVLVRFEAPADQSDAVKDYRADLGQQIYNMLSGSQPTDLYLSVISGSGSGYYQVGDTVNISAYTGDTEFVSWTVLLGTITLADASSANTSFIMPNERVTVKATYASRPSPTPAVRKNMPLWMMLPRYY